MQKLMHKGVLAAIGIFSILCVFIAVWFGGATAGPQVSGVRAEFYIFAITLIGVAIFHHHTLQVALTGLASLITLKLLFVKDFSLPGHLHHESSILLNLLGLLLGFSVLAKHFEESRVPDLLPRVLPDDWKGGFVLLVLVFIISSFLDNIAAAMIGGAVALTVFRGKVDTGYLAGIVAASNAGGSGSVVGDTTTTMMWIDGVAAKDIVHAYWAAFPALFIFGIILAKKQHRYNPITSDVQGTVKIEWNRIIVSALILIGAIATNILMDFPAAGVWIAIILGALFTKTPWKEVPNALKGSIFLLSLVFCASMMPVNELPKASWQSAFMLGVVSAVFDNIPLTKLALDQGGYDWGFLAYAVGFGGSMIWFGSSAGVAISNMFPQAKSVGSWLKHGWSVSLAYVIGFAIMFAVAGWHPHAPHKRTGQPETAPTAVVETVVQH